MELQINVPVKLPFVSSGLVTGKTGFSPIFVLDGSITTISATYSEIGNGVYTLNFTPASTGHLEVFIEGSLQVKAEVVSRTSVDLLVSLSDEALGSWSWDKTTGLLTLFKSDGSTLATYTVVDTVSIASRERLS